MFSRRNQERLKELEAENESLKRSVAELSLLNELAITIGASNDSQQIIQSVIKRVVKSVKASQGDLMLMKEDDAHPLTTFIRTSDSEMPGNKFSLNESLIGWMQIYKKPLLINSPAADDRFKGTKWNPHIKNIICAPLMIRTRLIGVLTAYNNNRSPSAFTEEDLRLLSIIASQSAQIIENARLYEEQQNFARVQEELRLAQEIQHSLLPQRQSEVPGYDVAGFSQPAQVVGGDYFDVFPTLDNQFAFCLGDASGKGLPASLFVSNVQATLQGQSLGNSSVSICLQRVNQLLHQRTHKGLFVTLFYGVLNPVTNQFSYANAGHNRPLLKRNTGQLETLSLGDIAMGFLPEFAFREDTIIMMPGDTLLIYSDGITEARNGGGEFFETERLHEIFDRSTTLPAASIIEHIMKAVGDFTRDAPQSDDMTLLVLKRNLV